ncbi:conserved hypothetical protein [Aliarcobacter butzleri JV22]|uniref:Uncharacterized protein n=1 Tax=Aliarcobacter butzleri L352 TaxID=1447260 RepID=A0A837JC96_9BACT|nr:phage holin family protein [Aliarcobacter butzleri]EFU69126.1 conserved hypothetical protein [Aliarcobacter butzleri JV22]KLE05562.1 hypothetical protein AF77_04575 [Aliarcobacter butzleri L352]MDN5054430.1 hypothetical protein [Aliarcobacter butzleri]
MNINDFIFWIYMAVISFFAGILGMLHREEHKSKDNIKGKFFLLFFGGISGVLVGYIAGEACFYWTQSARFSLAFSAFTAWIGAAVLLASQKRLLEFIQNYKKDSQ